MKLWVKIFLCSLILFEIVFNVGGWILLEYSFNQSLKREVSSGLGEQLTMHSGLEATGEILLSRNESDYKFYEEFLGAYFQNYMDYYSKENVFIEVRNKNNEKIYSSFPIDLNNREELNIPLNEGRNYIIREIKGKSYLFITNSLGIGEEEYKFSYIRNISEIYNSRKLQYNLFLIINIIIGASLGLGLYLLLRYMTKPIRKLNESVKIISEGNYSERVEVISSDEVGELSMSFNHMAQTIEDKIYELNKNSMEKQDFIQSLTHEMKTPLTSIIGYAELLRDTKYNEEFIIKGSHYIYYEAKRLERLSLKLMDLILLNKKDFILEEGDIKSIFHDLEGIIDQKVKSKDLRLELNINHCYRKIEIDLIKVLITNIIDNGVKASKSGDILKIGLEVDEEGRMCFYVEDEGIGIPEKDIERIFEPFYMVDKSRTRASNGAGLGLSICAKIVELHGGEIKVKSQLGKGTKVLVII